MLAIERGRILLTCTQEVLRLLGQARVIAYSRCSTWSKAHCVDLPELRSLIFLATQRRVVCSR